MINEKSGAVWLASYPKSGNTWLRLLLEAYRRNGLVDINELSMETSDGGAGIIRAVCPIELRAADRDIQLLLRPAALMNLLMAQKPGTSVKTHFANIRPDGDLPHCIPKTLTKKAVYIVRDPRSVVLSAARHFKYSIDAMVEEMNFQDFTLGGTGIHASCLVTSWSNHVSSWIGEKEFPVHVVKYEDMMADAAKELTEVLEFLKEEEDKEVDPKRVEKAVKACEIAKLEKAEDENGFHEAAGKGRKFFGGGGTRWQDELGPKWIKQIEEDHGDVMRALGYLEGTVSELKAVE